MNPAFVVVLCTGLTFAQQSAPLQAVPNPIPWWQTYVPTIVGFIQFLFLSIITIFVFLSNGAQKIRERQADWYHKVVVDHAINGLKELFGGMQKELLLAAENVDQLRRDNLQDARKASKQAIGKAKAAIFQLRSEMGFRLSAFDPALEQLFTREVEDLENEIVEWFTSQPERRCYDASTSLPAVLAKAQMRLLHVLMRKEFSTWGFTWPWSRRGALPPSLKS
jgi:hypothetical protein